MFTTSFLSWRFSFCASLLLFFLVFIFAHPTAGNQPQKPYLSSKELTGRLEKAGDNPFKLVVLLPHVDKQQATKIRLQIHKLLVHNSQILSVVELNEHGKKFAQALSPDLLTPEDLIEMLGNSKKVSRQILFRKYLEQWRYGDPLPLLITITHQKGLSPQVTKVQVLKP